MLVEILQLSSRQCFQALFIALFLQSIETVLGITLKDDIMISFSDGVVLCQLVNRLFPNTIPSIMDGEVCIKLCFIIYVKCFYAFSP